MVNFMPSHCSQSKLQRSCPAMRLVTRDLKWSAGCIEVRMTGMKSTKVAVAAAVTLRSDCSAKPAIRDYCRHHIHSRCFWAFSARKRDHSPSVYCKSRIHDWTSQRPSDLIPQANLQTVWGSCRSLPDFKRNIPLQELAMITKCCCDMYCPVYVGGGWTQFYLFVVGKGGHNSVPAIAWESDNTVLEDKASMWLPASRVSFLSQDVCMFRSPVKMLIWPAPRRLHSAGWPLLQCLAWRSCRHIHKQTLFEAQKSNKKQRISCCV